MPPGTWQKSAFWIAEETAHGEVTNLEAPYNIATQDGYQGKPLPTLYYSCQCWRSHSPWRRLVLEKPSVLQKPTLRKPHTLQGPALQVHWNREAEPFPSVVCLSSSLCWQAWDHASQQQQKVFKRPRYIFTEQKWKVNLELRGNYSITDTVFLIAVSLQIQSDLVFSFHYINSSMNLFLLSPFLVMTLLWPWSYPLL